MIQTSGISLCTTQKQIHEDTRDFAVYYFRQQNIRLFSAIDFSAIKDDL